MNHTESMILTKLGNQRLTFRQLAQMLRLPENRIHHALDNLLDNGRIQSMLRTADESEYTKA